MNLRGLSGVVITMFFVASVTAQNGEIAGKVIDENGDGIPVANIALIDAAGALTGTTTKTDMDGTFSIRPLSPGMYNLQIQYVGYTPSVQQGIIVKADRPTWMTIHLKPDDAVLAPAGSPSKKVKYSAPKVKRNRKPL